jgi:ubiquinol-cytochrome c reductase cytochrome c subunit
MHRRYPKVTPLIVFICVALCSGISALASPTIDSPAAQGRELYVLKGCYQCHGYDGQGGAPAPRSIAPNPLPLRAFISFIRRPSGVMPAYSPSVLSDDEMRIIREYLAAIPSPPDADSLSAIAEQ